MATMQARMAAFIAAIGPDVKNGLVFTVQKSRGGLLGTGVGTLRTYLPYACAWETMEAGVGSAPTGSTLLTLDVNKNGTTIFTTQTRRPIFQASSFRAAMTAPPDILTFAAGDYLTLDIDFVGNTLAGSDLETIIFLRRT